MKLKYLVSICYLLTTLHAFSQDNLFKASTIPVELRENASSVIRLAETRINIPKVDNLEHSYRRVITVLNENGNVDVLANVYYDEGISVKKLGAIVYDATGKVIKKYKKSDFNDVAAVSDISLFEDSRVKYIKYIPTSYPYTVEFYYEKSTKNTASIPKWHPLESFHISTEKSIYEITYNQLSRLNVKENNFNGFDIEKNIKDGYNIYIAKNLKAIKYEALKPSLKKIIPSLLMSLEQFNYEGYLGSAKSWINHGKWMYQDLLKNRMQLSENTKNKIKELVKEKESDIEKAKVIYNYVQNNTRYISIQEGVGGMQPMLASDVDNLKYGDCKALTNYTKALLDVVGVNSYYTRLYASPNLTSVSRDFVSFLGQTNHVILNIPNGDDNIWLECTNQKVPFGHIAGFTDDRDVLVITPEGGKIEHTKIYSSKENYLKSDADITLDINGGFKAVYKSAAGGTRYNAKFNVFESDTKDKSEHYKENWDYLNDLTLEKIELKNDRDNIEVTEHIEVTVPKYAVMAGEKMLIKPNVFKRSTYVPPRYSERKLPFVIQRGYVNEDTFEIAIPEGFAIEALPESKEIKTKFGVYKMSLTKAEETKVKYQRYLEIFKGDYPKEEYSSYRSFRRKIAKADKSSFVINKAN